MSEFVSWIEMPTKVKGKPKIYFLTHNKVFNTKKGKLLQKELKGDFIGHSAIRFYYDLAEHPERGRLHEKGSTRFSSPSNFPSIVVRAIKRGAFKGFPLPAGLLSKPIDNKYWADRKSIDDKYWDLFANPENRVEAWR